MGKMITGSIDLTKILEAAKAKHSAFSKAESNGHIYMNVLIWENDEPDKFQNNFSFQIGTWHFLTMMFGHIVVHTVNILKIQALLPSRFCISQNLHVNVVKLDLSW